MTQPDTDSSAAAGTTPASLPPVIHTGKDGPQRIRAGHKRWNEEAEAIFLDHLAASCNVAWSAAQTDFSVVTFYNRRRTDPAFARKWAEALDHGYIRLETELLGTATSYVERLREDPDLPLKHMSVREAISLLRRHGGKGGDPTARGGRFQARPRSLDEVRDSILSKLEAIEAARRAEAASFETAPQDEREGKDIAQPASVRPGKQS